MRIAQGLFLRPRRHVGAASVFGRGAGARGFAVHGAAGAQVGRVHTPDGSTAQARCPILTGIDGIPSRGSAGWLILCKHEKVVLGKRESAPIIGSLCRVRRSFNDGIPSIPAETLRSCRSPRFSEEALSGGRAACSGNRGSSGVFSSLGASQECVRIDCILYSSSHAARLRLPP